MKLHSVIFLPLLLWSNNQMTGAFDLSGPDTHKVLIGSVAILRCSFNVDKLPLDTQFLAIHWFFMGNQILAYDNMLHISRPGLTIDLEAAVMGDASLIISKVNISDKGVYKCRVIYSPHSKVKDIKLDVEAHPIMKIVTKPVIKDEENTLRCSITGFYPPDITITWLWGAEVLDTHEMYEPQRQEDGTYNVSSAVVIIPTDDSMNKTCTCRVTHVSLQFPVEKTFHLILTERADVRSSEGSADWSYTTFTGLFIAIPVVLLLLVVLLTGWIWKNRVCTQVQSTGNDEGSGIPESQKLQELKSSCPESTESTALRSSPPKSPESTTSKPSIPESPESKPSSPGSPESTPLRPSPGSPESTLSRPSAKSRSDPSKQSPPESPVFPLVEPFVVLQVPSKSTTLELRVSSSSQLSSRELGPPPQVKCQDDVQQGFLQPRLYLSGHEHSAKTYHWGHPFGD
ncbi:tyrosine-protein phosphatase non-receptor type substrate 1-like isoform X1 [Ranitomeya variabilis]|uniref:tyrosine-protein phosphatase non-receptor type substrate 1-like isoform X1 n=1 Tax=Ranitomeya variabilis TaxID=490064 RepID=UPI004055BA97